MIYRVYINEVEIPTADVLDFQTDEVSLNFAGDRLISSKSTIKLTNHGYKYDDRQETDGFFSGLDWYNIIVKVWDELTEEFVWEGRLKTIQINDKDLTTTLTVADYVQDLVDTTCVINLAGQLPSDIIYSILTDPDYLNIPEERLIKSSFDIATAQQLNQPMTIKYTIQDGQKCISVLEEICKITNSHLFTKDNKIGYWVWTEFNGVLGNSIFDSDLVPGSFSQETIDETIINNYSIIYKNGAGVAYAEDSDEDSIAKYGGGKSFAVPSSPTGKTTAAEYKILFDNATGANYVGSQILSRHKNIKKVCKFRVTYKLYNIKLGDVLDLRFTPFVREPVRVIGIKADRNRQNIEFRCEYINFPEVFEIRAVRPYSVHMLEPSFHNGNIFLQWEHDINVDPLFYKLYFSTSENYWGTDFLDGQFSPRILVASQLDIENGYAQYKVSNVTEGFRYFFSVIVVDDEYNESLRSNTVSVIAPSPQEVPEFTPEYYRADGSIWEDLKLRDSDGIWDEGVIPSQEIVSPTYAIGDNGPSGGLVYYVDETKILECLRYDIDPNTWLTLGGDIVFSGDMDTSADIGESKNNTNKLIEPYTVLEYDTWYIPSLEELDLMHKELYSSTYKDWYLPSRDELNKMYENLHYEGVGGFNPTGVYWSSSEMGSEAWCQNFADGQQSETFKDSNFRVRAIRDFISERVYALRDVGPQGGLIFHYEDLGGGWFKYYESSLTDQSAGMAWITGGDTQSTSNMNTQYEIGSGRSNSFYMVTQFEQSSSAARTCRAVSTGIKTSVGGFNPTGLYCSSSDFIIYGATYGMWMIDYPNGIRGWQFNAYAKTQLGRIRVIRSFTDSIGLYSLMDVGPEGGFIFHIVNNLDETFTYYEAYPEDYTEGAVETFQSGGVGADMFGTGYITGMGIGDGKDNTQTIITFFDSLVLSSDGATTYYDYDWDSLTDPDTEDFTDGINTYAMSFANDGVVAGTKSENYIIIIPTSFDTFGAAHDCKGIQWNLPSKDELQLMHDNLHAVALGDFDGEYWSSTEYSYNQAISLDFDTDTLYNRDRDTELKIRPVRSVGISKIPQKYDETQYQRSKYSYSGYYKTEYLGFSPGFSQIILLASMPHRYYVVEYRTYENGVHSEWAIAPEATWGPGSYRYEINFTDRPKIVQFRIYFKPRDWSKEYNIKIERIN